MKTPNIADQEGQCLDIKGLVGAFKMNFLKQLALKTDVLKIVIALKCSSFFNGKQLMVNLK